MKRTIIDSDSLSMANCLMLLSDRKEYYNPNILIDDSVPNKVFECKTCNRQFSSFQALGGHRASHKKPKLTTTSGDESSHTSSSSSPLKPKTHECSICGLEFAVGQALGGHMRRHRAAALMNDSNTTSTTTTTPPPLNLLPPDHHPIHQLPLVKKSNSTRVLCLDLNLTPMENVLEFRLGKPVKPVIDCSI